MPSPDRKIAVSSNVTMPCRRRQIDCSGRYSVLLGSLATGKKIHLIRRLAKPDQSATKSDERPAIVGHYDHILAIAISSDGQFLVRTGDSPLFFSCTMNVQVSGDNANLIQVWNARTCQHLKTLRGHKGPITVRIYSRTFFSFKSH